MWRLLLILPVLTACAHREPWTPRDTALQTAIVAVMLLDAHSTAQIQDRPDIVEKGPVARHVLGDNPQTSDTYLYFGTLALSSWLISRTLPARWRPYYQGIVLLDHSYMVINNCNLGLCGE